jgi:hypothetical protein
MLFKRLPIAALAALTLACGGDDRPVLRVGPSGTAFQRELIPSTSASPVATVPYTTWNRGNATAFIPACGARASAVVERLVGGRWESYSSVFCIDIMMETPIELRAGESRQDAVAIGDAGHFRILMPYSASVGASTGYSAVSRDFDVY